MGKFVYMGTSEFAVPALQAIADEVVLVVSQPDRPSGRGMKMQPSPVKLAAKELGLPVETPERASTPEFVERIRELEADALIVAAYGQILRTKLLEATRRGGINLHGSILPKYRGAAPIQRAILEGETTTGVTLMQMDKGMDTGDMIHVVTTEIGPDETYGELQRRLAKLAAGQLEYWLKFIETGEYPRQIQDSELATHAPKVERDETVLDFNRSAESEYRRFRAFTPSPGTSVQTTHGRIRLGQVRMGDGSGAPGEVLNLDPFTVAFREGSLAWLEIQPEGKKRMSGRDFANGARLRPGTRLIE